MLGLIQKIFINVNGMPIIAKDFVKKISGNELNEDLLSPYINAITNFAQQVHQDKIEAIVMSKSKLFYRELKGYTGATVLCVADREDEALEVNSKLNLLINRFVNSYSKEDYARWDGDNSFFDPFYLILDEIIMGDQRRLSEDFKIRFIETANVLKNNFEKVVRAVIIGDPKIIIVGEEKQIESVIKVLEIFAYGKVLNTIYLSDKDQDADILGVTHKDFKYFDLRGGKMIVDLIKGKVLGNGNSDLYCRALIKDIRGLNYENALRIIHCRLSVIYNKVNSILVLSHSGQLDSKLLDLILKDIDKNAKSLILALLGKHDVKSFELIEKYGIMEKKY